jgi:predicted DNA-binding transcriptional regulator AlpA
MKENAVDQHRLLDLSELAQILGCSPGTIKNNLRRNPDAVPRRLVVPGGRMLRWRLEDVVTWLSGHVEEAKE